MQEIFAPIGAKTDRFAALRSYVSEKQHHASKKPSKSNQSVGYKGADKATNLSIISLFCKKMNRMTREMIKSMPAPRKHRTDYDYPLSPEDRSKAADELCDRIRAAFTGVKLEDGIGLWEAQGLDDYEPPGVCATYRLKDEAEDWNRISDETLQRCNSSPSFLDAKGFRFYMPAFMLSELRGDYGFDFHWSLIHFDTLGYARYELLDTAQRAAVRDYLIFFASDPDDTYSRDDIMYALETFWTEASCKVPTEPESTEAEVVGGNRR